MPATIDVNGKPLREEVRLYFVSGTNSRANKMPIGQTAEPTQMRLSNHRIMVPPYSVVRVDF